MMGRRRGRKGEVGRGRKRGERYEATGEVVRKEKEGGNGLKKRSVGRMEV